MQRSTGYLCYNRGARKGLGVRMRTKSGIKLGIGIPQGFPDGNIDLELIQRFVSRAEVLGYDDLWVSEQIRRSGR